VTHTATPEIDLPRFSPGDPTLLKDPYPTYTRYREADPVHWGNSTMADLPGSWFLFRHADNVALLSDSDTFANDPASVGMQAHVPPAFQPVAAIFQRWLGGMDAPDHRRLRTIMAKTFTPRRVADLRPRVEAITESLLSEAMQRGDSHLDVVGDLSFPLPMAVVGDALGVQEGDWRLFQGWAADISNAVDRAGDAVAAAAGSDAISGMFDYFKESVVERRRRPTDDLLSVMVAAADDEGAPMQEYDAIAIATELGVAGHETTTNGVAKSLLGLMAQRDRWEELKSMSEVEMDAAIEELLRWSTPVQRQRWRWAVKDTVLGGQKIERGQSVVSVLGAANRDPEQFPDPDRIDFARSTEGHLTFGYGSHFCLGSSLARLEMKVALRQLATSLPDMRLVEDPVDIEWRNNSIIAGPARLLVEG
jgi:cytochrome P450